MATKLTEEQVRELERFGDEPMPLEHPITHQQYLLVPIQRIERASPGWTQAKNARRFDLIDKDIAGNLTADETVELHLLNGEIDRFLDETEPLPVAPLRELHDRLLRQSIDESGQP